MSTGRHRRRVIPATFAGVTPRPNDRCGQQKLQVRKCRVVACVWFSIFFCGSPPMNTNVTGVEDLGQAAKCHLGHMLPILPTAALSPDRYLELSSNTSMPGRMQTTLSAPAMAGSERAKLNNKMGRVSTCPSPIRRVRTYWLQEIRKVNRAPTTTPRKTAGRVT